MRGQYDRKTVQDAAGSGEPDKGSPIENGGQNLLPYKVLRDRRRESERRDESRPGAMRKVAFPSPVSLRRRHV
jgi:hypothetical protein